MNINPDDIIHELIFKPRTVERLSRDLELDVVAIQRMVWQLFERGQVAPALDHVWGDVRCNNGRCNSEFEREYSVPRDLCTKCGSTVEDMCVWRFVGGPVSEALAVYVQVIPVRAADAPVGGRSRRVGAAAEVSGPTVL